MTQINKFIPIARDVTDPANQVALTIHTPTGLVSRLDVFAHTNLLQDTPWTLLVDAGNVDANGKLAFQDDVEWFERRYYAAANADTDNDGLPDGRERFPGFLQLADDAVSEHNDQGMPARAFLCAHEPDAFQGVRFWMSGTPARPGQDPCNACPARTCLMSG